VKPGDAFEIRAPKCLDPDGRRSTRVGYFTAESIDEAAREVKALDDAGIAPGIYVLLNPVAPGLVGQSPNQISIGAAAAKDADILARRWLLIDVDPVRPSDTSSTDDELRAAESTALAVRDHLRSLGWPDPVFALSGNGYHMIYRVELPAEDQGLTRRLLQVLAAKFDSGRAKVDRSVHNPARITKLIGTMARKGPNHQDAGPDSRPHRRSMLIDVPQGVCVVPIALIDSLARTGGPPPMQTAATLPLRPPSHPGGPLPPGSHYVTTAFLSEVNQVRQATNGERNVTLNKAAFALGQFVATGRLDRAHVEAALLAATSLPEQEARSTIASGLKGGMQNPRPPEKPRAKLSPPPPLETKTPAQAAPSGVLSVPPWNKFPVETFPEPVRRFISEAAAALGCDPSMVALPALATLAGAIGLTHVVELKCGWQEPAIVWAILVARSGSLKTPARNAALRPLVKVQEAEIKTYREKKEKFDRDMEEAGDSDGPRPKEPKCVRHIVGDATVEALAKILADNPRGVLLDRDEAAGWFGGFNKYKPNGRGGDVAAWLEAWQAGPWTNDRKTGPDPFTHVPRAAISVCGTIQPGILLTALGDEHIENGLAARTLMAFPPSIRKVWTSATISQAAQQAFEAVVSELTSIQVTLDDLGRPAPVVLPLADDALDLWIRFYNAHAGAQADAVEDRIAAAFAKMEAYAARFALIFQLVRWRGGTATNACVDAESMAAGIEVARWFIREVRRVYAGMQESQEQRALRRLAEIIVAKGRSVSVREWQKSRSHTRSAEAREELERLVAARWGHWELPAPGPGGGRPSERFILTISMESDETLDGDAAEGVLSDGPGGAP
jgi:hypothetical protein